MNIFFIAMQHIVGVKEIQYSSPYDYEYWKKIYEKETQERINILFYVHGIFSLSSSSLRYKFKGLCDFLDNSFIHQERKDKFLTIFSKAQRVYYGFSMLVKRFRYKRAKIQIHTDLCLNEIKETDRNVFVVLQNKSKYLFTVSDLSKILVTGLTNMSYFFLEPYVSKNPYNNIIFSDSVIIAFYSFIKERNFNMPPLLDAFYRSNLSIKRFIYDNESMIKTAAIKNYTYSTPYTILHYDISSMLFVNNQWTKKLKIHREFPKDKLVAIFRPYLHLFYLYKYFTMGTEKTVESCELLIEKLKQFVLFNPKFGRKIIKIDKKFNFEKVAQCKERVITEYFNMNHIDFYAKTVLEPANEECVNDSSSYTEEEEGYEEDGYEHVEERDGYEEERDDVHIWP